MLEKTMKYEMMDELHHQTMVEDTSMYTSLSEPALLKNNELRKSRSSMRTDARNINNGVLTKNNSLNALSIPVP